MDDVNISEAETRKRFIDKALEKAGVDYIHVSGGNHHTAAHQITPMHLSLAHNVWAAETIKKEVSLPVIASGSITTPELAEEILSSGKGDFISLGRPLFADPYFPKKAQEGRPEDIAPCIRCNDGCAEKNSGRQESSDTNGRATSKSREQDHHATPLRIRS